MAVQLTDGTNNNVVDATSKGILVQPSKVVTQSGYTALASVLDNGAITGTPLARPIDSSVDERLTVGIDTTILTDVFNYTAQNTALWSNNLTTMTLTYSGGYAFLNAGGSLASGAFAVMKSYRMIPQFQIGGIHFEMRGYLTQTPQTNNTVYIGMGIPGTTAAPTDGVYFQYDATGVFKCVVNFNGTLATSAALTAPSANATHEFEIQLADDNAEFWIDGVLYALVGLPTGATLSTLSGSASVFIQNTNTGATGAAQGVKVAYVNVYLMDVGGGKPWQHQMTGQGLIASQGQNGGTMGSTSNITNSLATAAAATLTNTTAAAGTGLGGQFSCSITLATPTDGIVCSYLNPAATVNITGRTLYITGVKVQSYVLTALTTNPGIIGYTLCYGHNALSLATAEGATTKAPRRIPLGFEVYGSTAAIGTVASPSGVYMPFNSPIAVNPGEYVALALKNMGTAPATGALVIFVTYDGYWE